MANKTASKSQNPCAKEESLVFPPASALAELLTITAVMGIPPSIPLKKFPVPWAISSRFCGVIRLNGSNLSMAAILNRVSSVATKQIMMALRHISVLLKSALNLGNLIWVKMSCGMVTNCVGFNIS